MNRNKKITGINALETAGVFFLQGALIGFISYFALNIANYDLSVPFQYAGDSIIILIYIKSLLQDGWPTIITQLSAPYSYPGAAFPMLTSFDWLIMKVISCFTNEPGYILNIFWLSTLVFSAWSSSYAAYQLGLNRIWAFGLGVLYAFLPFALLRNVAHLSLVYYLVPLLCLLSIIIASHGEGVRNLKEAKIVGFLACVFQGFNYIYFSFFAVIIFGVASILVWRRSKGVKQFYFAIIAISLVLMSVALNLVPLLVSKYNNGPAPDMGYKHTAEAEIYGAKIRKMIAPHPDNLIKPLSIYAVKDIQAQFPNDNENVTARLGLFGAIGLMLSILIVLRRHESDSRILISTGSLGLATLLIITVGGFGAVINIITVPDIRGYNRFSVFLSFYVMLVFGLFVQSKIGSLAGWSKRLSMLAVFVFVLLSLYDQLLDRGALVASQKDDMMRSWEERKIIDTLENTLPKGAAVLQLPFTGYPPLAIFNNMQSYDHARAYLWSSDLKWSWPSFSLRHRAWQAYMENKHGADFINAAIFSGFSAIWIDRAAYKDKGQSIISSLTQGVVGEIPLSSDRFVVLNLTEEAKRLKSHMSDAQYNQGVEEAFEPIVIEWGNGFYEQEKTPDGMSFRWSKSQSKLLIHNYGEKNSNICLKLTITAQNPGSMAIGIQNSEVVFSDVKYNHSIVLPLSILANKVVNIDLQGGMERLNAPGDSRELYFHVSNLHFEKKQESGLCVDGGR